MVLHSTIFWLMWQNWLPIFLSMLLSSSPIFSCCLHFSSSLEFHAVLLFSPFIIHTAVECQLPSCSLSVVAVFPLWLWFIAFLFRLSSSLLAFIVGTFNNIVKHSSHPKRWEITGQCYLVCFLLDDSVLKSYAVFNMFVLFTNIQDDIEKANRHQCTRQPSH